MRLTDVDWSDLNSVIKYAKTLRDRHVVIKCHNRSNYNVVHYARKALWHSDRATAYYITGKAK
jgi:hypothetical protein